MSLPAALPSELTTPIDFGQHARTVLEDHNASIVVQKGTCDKKKNKCSNHTNFLDPPLQLSQTSTQLAGVIHDLNPLMIPPKFRSEMGIPSIISAQVRKSVHEKAYLEIEKVYTSEIGSTH